MQFRVPSQHEVLESLRVFKIMAASAGRAAKAREAG
jgi:hypothetical protein